MTDTPRKRMYTPEPTRLRTVAVYEAGSLIGYVTRAQAERTNARERTLGDGASSYQDAQGRSLRSDGTWL